MSNPINPARRDKAGSARANRPPKRRKKNRTTTTATNNSPREAAAVIIVHDSRCAEYSASGHVERPARIQRSVPIIKDRHPAWEWRQPKPATEAALLRAHSPGHLAQIRAAAQDFDTDTP